MVHAGVLARVSFKVLERLYIQRNTRAMHMAVYRTVYSLDLSLLKKNMVVYIQESKEHGPKENTS